MSSIEELEEKVKELMKVIETLKRQEKTEEFEYPFEDKEEYFCLNINGEIIRNLWSGGPFDEGVYTQGHVFKNIEEARKERDKRALLMRFNQFRDKCNGDWKPDFKDDTSWKYYISLKHTTSAMKIYSCLNLEEFNLFGYFRKESDAARAVELFGDEIKRLFVEELK